MAEEKSGEELSLGEIDQALFGEEQAAPDVPGPNVTELLQLAGLQRNSPAPEPAAEPAAEPEVIAEPQPAGEPLSPDVLQQLVQQQTASNQQMLELQQQLVQQQQQPQFNIDDSRQVAEKMEQIGLDPTDAAHHYMFRSDYENRQREAAYHQQMQGMSEYITQLQQQQHQHQAEQSVTPEIASALKAYGEVPDATVENIKSHAATLMSHGQYDQAQAIQAAVEPYLPLLRMLQQNQPAAQPSQSQPAPPAQNTQAVLAAALAGRSTGHGPTVTDISLEDLESKLFS